VFDAYVLKLSQFEGPLDLLLYLIKFNEVDVFSVDLSSLSLQYLEHLRVIQFSSLRDAAGFLAMGATLCEIKSLRLLPHSAQASEDEETDAERLEEQLKERLREYQELKDAAVILDSFRSANERVFTNISESKRLETEFEGRDAPIKGHSSTLLVLYEQLLTSLVSRTPAPKIKTQKEILTIEDVITRLRELIEDKKTFVLQEHYSLYANRYEFGA
jgi:segregation and condensation protein A